MRRALAAAIAAAFFIAVPAKAQEWPQRQVSVVVPFAAGGSTDLIARIVAQHMQAKFGVPFVVENKAGAGGTIGTDIVAKAAPDGYTLLMAVVSDYGNYRQFMPNFVASRVLSQRGGQALMYVEVSALDGMATLWAEMQLHLLETTAPARVIKATMRKGNVKEFEAEWQVTPFGAKHTLVAFELCADPDFHVPFANSLVSDYNEIEARDSIAALRLQVSRHGTAQAR